MISAQHITIIIIIIIVMISVPIAHIQPIETIAGFDIYILLVQNDKLWTVNKLLFAHLLWLRLLLLLLLSNWSDRLGL